MEILIAFLKAVGLITFSFGTTGLIVWGANRNPIATIIILVIVLLIILTISFM